MVQPTSDKPVVWIRFLFQLLLLELTCHQHCLAGELRFCYKGPQRILYKDCPGGFVAKHIVNATCLYYYKADNVPNMHTYLSTEVCEQQNFYRMLNADFEDFTSSTFQSVEFEPDIAGGPTDGSDPAIDKCNDTCLVDWQEPKYWHPSKIFKDKADLNDAKKEEFRKEYINVTKVILIKIINEDQYEEDTEIAVEGYEEETYPKVDFTMDNLTIIDTPMTSLMKLLAKSMKIIYRKCSPFIEPTFYRQVFRTMIEFRKLNDKFPDMNVLPLKRIMKMLDKCESQQQPYFMINGTRCENKYIAQTITNLKRNVTKTHKLQETSFRWGRYDPIIEAAWSAIAFVHAYCFDFFVQDMLHYSLYIKGMDQIFVQPLVEKHWMYPFPIGKAMRIWEMTYDTPDIKNQMSNLDACVQGAYMESMFQARLDRPFNKEEFFQNPEYEDDTSIPPPGWHKHINDYWEMYEKSGFQEMVEELGYCASTSEEIRLKTEQVADETCFLHSKKK